MLNTTENKNQLSTENNTVSAEHYRQHTPATDELTVNTCDINDKECQRRWFQAVSDCC